MKYNGLDVKFRIGVYSNGRLAIELIDAEDGMPLAKVTVNVVDAELNEDEVVIKDYSENEGMYDFLEINGLIKQFCGFLTVGYSKCPIVKLNMEAIK